MPGLDGGARTHLALIREVVGTQHDTVPPCALCTVLLAEMAAEEELTTASLFETPEGRRLIERFHVKRSSELRENSDIEGMTGG